MKKKKLSKSNNLQIKKIKISKINNLNTIKGGSSVQTDTTILEDASFNQIC